MVGCEDVKREVSKGIEAGVGIGGDRYLLTYLYSVIMVCAVDTSAFLHSCDVLHVGGVPSSPVKVRDNAG